MNQGTRDRIKSAWAFYQRVMFSFTIGWNEINKPLAPFREVATFIVLLELAGIKFKWIELVIAYILFSIAIYAYGEIMRRNGVVKFNNFLQNQENEMMMKISEIAENMKK